MRQLRKKKGSSSKSKSSAAPKQTNVNTLTSKTNKLTLNDNQPQLQNPIYSQVPKQLYPTDRQQQPIATNGNNRNLIITNGTTNADSWV